MWRNEVEGRATKVAHSIFVMNFPSGTSARQLWDICEQYGKVVDTFIPARVSKEAVSNDARPHKVEKHMEDKPVMVIDTDCLFDKNSDLTMVAKVKTVDSMPNLRIIFNDEGFKNVSIRYLGGFWVSLKFTDTHACDNFKRHEDVEGIPSVAWTNKAFTKIAKKMGELLFTEDPDDNNLWRKRPCVVTKEEDFIMGSFKIIIKGKVSVIRACEFIGWTPDFKKEETETSSDNGDEESKKSIPYKDICSGVKGKGSSESDGKRDMDNNNGDVGEKSDDPFSIYNLLTQKDKNIEEKRMLWNYLHEVLNRWKGEVIVMRDFNKVYFPSERYGSVFNKQGATSFNSFIDTSNLIDIPLGGFSFTWAVKDATKMRFEELVKDSWHNDVVVDINEMSYLKKKFQMLKKKIKIWDLRDLDAFREKDLVQKAKVKRRGYGCGDKKAVWDCGRDKSPGPNGFTFEFMEVIGGTVCRAVKCFFQTGTFPKGCNPSFIALIPKVNDAKFLKDFRPISIIGCQYKIVKKILTNRLSLVVGSLVSKEQSAFIRGHQILDGSHESLHISHLFYAEDAVFIGEWKEENLHHLVSILRCFYLASSLWINIHKCCIMGVGGVKHDEVIRGAHLIECEAAKTPFKYLRVMVGSKMSHIHSWDLIINKVVARLSNGRRRRFLLVVGVLKRLESWRSSFFRGMEPDVRKASWWFSWDNVAAGKEVGGLGKSSNWLDCIRSISHLKGRGVDLYLYMKKKVGNGNDSLFWLENWLGEGNLKVKYPRLFALEENKEVFIRDKVQNGLRFGFRRTLKGEQKNLDGEGVFLVSSARRFIDEGLCVMDGSPSRWLKLIPIKVNILAWRLASNKLPTRFLGWWGLSDIGISRYQGWLNWFDGLRLRKEVKDCLEINVTRLRFRDAPAYFAAICSVHGYLLLRDVSLYLLDIKSVLTQKYLKIFCQNFHIPDDVHPQLPGLNQIIHEMSLERLVSILDFLTAKVSHFEILCRVHGIEPTVRLLRESMSRGKRLMDSTVGRLVSLLPVAPARAESELEASVDRLFDECGSADHVDSAAGGDQDVETEMVTGIKIIAAENLREDHETFIGAATGGKYPSVFKELLASSILSFEAGVEAVATLPLVTSSIFATPEHESGAPADSITGLNLRTISPSKRFAISSESSHHSITNATDARIDSFIRSVALPPVMTEAVITINIVSILFASAPETGTKVISSVHAFMFHDSDSKGTVKSGVAGSSYIPGKVLSMGSQEINSETIHQVFVLQGNVSNNTLLDDHDDLDLKDLNVAVSSLRSQKDGLVDQVAKLDADLLEMALHLEEKFYPHLPTTISALGVAINRAINKGMQDGLSASIIHGREGRSLADVAAYNLVAEADYNSALQRLREMDFLLLFELSSYKNASVEDIMSLLWLEGLLADTPGMSDLQPNVDQENITAKRSALIGVWDPLVDPLSAENLVGMTGTSDSVPAAIATTTALSTTFASTSFVPPITIEDYEIAGTDGPENAQGQGQGNVTSFPTVEFEKEDLDTTLEPS
uniref:RNA-directed DNA polymerase, eukaryota n=1 Tax=Tanacetum cinerariifolium TaxID=118510 RepID=A0A6L2L3W3_TANCI|nr:RNA-directed DNA polymerase, eukaryota [Tanacetum cinerariifolium]